MTDKIIRLFGPDVLTVAKPLITLLQAELLRLYPDQDFTFQADEFVRDNPENYELRLDWQYNTPELFANPEAFQLGRLELIRPLRILREVIGLERPLSYYGTLREVLLPYLVEQAREQVFPAYSTTTVYQTRFVW